MHIFSAALFILFLIHTLSEECTYPYSEYLFVRTYQSHSYEEEVEIWKGEQNVGASLYTLSGVGQEGVEVTYSLCLEQTIYTLVFYDYGHNCWDSGSSLLIYSLDHSLLLSYTLTNPQESSIYFYPNMLISSSDEWKYTIEPQISSSWTSPSFFDASWSTFIPGEFPFVSSITRYYRRRATLPSHKRSFTLAEIGIKTREGFILYINGQEISRYLLPSGLISSQYSISKFDSQLVYHIVTIPLLPDLFTTNILTFCVEIHGLNSTNPYIDPFQAYFFLLYDSPLPRIHNGSFSISSNENSDLLNGDSIDSPTLLLDHNASTFILISSLPFLLDYTFPYGRSEFISGFSIRTYNEDSTFSDPNSIKIQFYGYNSDLNSNTYGEWILLYQENHVNLNVPSSTLLFTFCNLPHAFPSYRVTLCIYSSSLFSIFLASDEILSHSFSLSEFELYAIRDAYMTSPILYYYSLNDKIHYSSHPYLLEEYPFSNQNNITFPFIFYKEKTNSPYFPAVSGFTSFSVSPPLPQGLTLDPNTGIISGIPIELQTPTLYVIQAVFHHLTTTTCTLPLYIAVYDCSFPNTYIHISKSTVFGSMDIKERFILSYQDHEEIHILSDYTPFYFFNKFPSAYIEYFCLPRGTYMITTNSTREKGWNDQSLLEISIQMDLNSSLLISRHKLSSSSSSFPFQAGFEPPIEISTFINYHSLPLNWTDPSYLYNINDYLTNSFLYTSTFLYTHSYVDDHYLDSNPLWYSYMNTSTIEEPKDVHSSTLIWLFRSIYNLSIPNTCVQYEFDYRIRGGIFIYLDGQLILREQTQDLQLSLHSYASYGLKMNDPPIWKSFFGPCSILSDGIHVFSIAVLPFRDGHPPKLDYEERFRWILDSNINTFYHSMDLLPSYVDSRTHFTTNPQIMTDRQYTTNWVAEYPANRRDPYGLRIDGISEKAFSFNKFCIVTLEYYETQVFTNFTFSLYNIHLAQWMDMHFFSSFQMQKGLDTFCFYVSEPSFYLTNAVEVVFTISNPPFQNYVVSIAEIEFYTVDLSEFSFPSTLYSEYEYSFYTNITFSLIPQTDFFCNYSISPSLPSTLSLDPTRGILEGYSSTSFSILYIITAISYTLGPKTYELLLTIQDCPITSIFFTLVFQSFSSNQTQNGYELYNSPYLSSSSLLDSIRPFPPFYGSFRRSYCLPQQDYTLVLYSPSNIGWNGTQFILYLENSIEYLRGTVYYGESPKHIQLSLTYLIHPIHTLWRSFIGSINPGPNWYSNRFNDSSWTLIEPQKRPGAEIWTHYYRVSFNVSSFSSYSIYILRLFIQSGTVLYLNSKKIYDYWLPSEYSYVTSSIYGTSHPIEVLLTSSTQYGVLQEGTNWLGLEVHPYPGLKFEFSVRLSLLLVYESNYLSYQPLLRYISPNSIRIQSLSTINNLFDMNIHTVFRGIFNDQMQYISYIIPYSGSSYYNTITLVRSDSSDDYLPTFIRVEGSTTSEDTWDILFIEYNITFGSVQSFQGRQTFHFYNTKSYSSYRIYLKSSISQEIELADLLFSYEQIVSYCPIIGSYSAAVDGQSSYRDCYPYYTGVMKRVCTQGKWESELNLCILSSPSIVLYDSTVYRFIKDHEISMDPPIVQAADYYLSISPDLPEGIQMNTKSGEFYGIPQEEFRCTSYTILTMNQKGTSSTSLTLCVDPNPQVGDSTFTFILFIILCVLILLLALLVYINHFRREMHRNFQLPRKIQQRKYIK